MHHNYPVTAGDVVVENVEVLQLVQDVIRDVHVCDALLGEVTELWEILQDVLVLQVLQRVCWSQLLLWSGPVLLTDRLQPLHSLLVSAGFLLVMVRTALRGLARLGSHLPQLPPPPDVVVVTVYQAEREAPQEDTARTEVISSLAAPA